MIKSCDKQRGSRLHSSGSEERLPEIFKKNGYKDDMK